MRDQHEAIIAHDRTSVEPRTCADQPGGLVGLLDTRAAASEHVAWGR